MSVGGVDSFLPSGLDGILADRRVVDEFGVLLAEALIKHAVHF
jgi:hypothetical protein